MNVKRQAVWHDSLALWQDTLKKNPNSPTAAAGLGEAFRIHGNLHEADNYFRLAMRLCRGKNADTQMMRAVVLDGLGNKEKAADLLELALDLDPRLADPDSRVATLAMSQEEASAIKGLLSRHPSGRGGRIQIDFFTHQLPKLPVNIED